MASKPDWSRQLPEPIDVAKRGKLRTLADVRDFLLALPPERAMLAGWQGLAGELLDAAKGGDLKGVLVMFKLARALHGLGPRR